MNNFENQFDIIVKKHQYIEKILSNQNNLDRDELIKQIAHHEGIVLKVYKDSLGIDTIGIGRNLEHRGIEDLELAHIEKTMSEIYENGISFKTIFNQYKI